MPTCYTLLLTNVDSNVELVSASSENFYIPAETNAAAAFIGIHNASAVGHSEALLSADIAILSDK